MKRALGRLASLLFDLHSTFLFMCRQEGLLDLDFLESEKCVILCLARVQLLLLFILEYLCPGDRI